MVLENTRVKVNQIPIFIVGKLFRKINLRYKKQLINLSEYVNLTKKNPTLIRKLILD